MLPTTHELSGQTTSKWGFRRIQGVGARARETWQTFSRSAQDAAVTERAAFDHYAPNLFTSDQIGIVDFGFLEGDWIALVVGGQMT